MRTRRVQSFLLYSKEGPNLAYEAARDYCELYDPCFGTGLIPASAPMVREIGGFLGRALFQPARERPGCREADPMRQRPRPTPELITQLKIYSESNSEYPRSAVPMAGTRWRASGSESW